MSASAPFQTKSAKITRRSSSGAVWERTEIVACPICGPGQTRLRYVARDWRYGSEGDFQIVECCGCSLAFLNPRPPIDEAPKFYPEDYPAHDPATVSPKPPTRGLRRWLRDAALAAKLDYPLPIRAPLLARRVGPLLAPVVRSRPWPRYSRNGRLLDVGFGRGDYLQDMRANGWEVYGVDLSPRAIAEAQRKDLCVFQGTLVSVYRQLPQPLDVVTFFDSFEHHPNPIETLECVAVLLRPGGELIIEFPNYGSPWRRIFGRYWADLAPPQHYFHYSSAVLTRLVERCGFAVDAVFARPSSEIQRSWQIRRIALGHEDAPLEGWGRLLDRLVGRGHLMLRARKR